MSIAIATQTGAFGQSGSRTVDTYELGKAAAIGYAANVEAFRFYRCRFRMSKGQAKSVEDALAGRLLNRVSWDNRMLVDETYDLYEGLGQPIPPNRKAGNPLPGHPGMRSAPASPVSSAKYLADGKHELSYKPLLQAINLSSKERGRRGIDYTPLAMFSVDHRNARGPNTLIASEHNEMSSDGLQELDGQPVVIVRFKDKRDGFVIEFSLDGSRGYLPRRIVQHWADKRKTEIFVTNVRECSKGRWFPERVVCIDPPDKTGMFDVTEMMVLELDADRRPGEEEFAFTFPAGTQVLDNQNPKKDSFKLRQNELVKATDIPKLFKLLDERRENPLMDTAIPRTSSWRWIYGLGAVCGVAVTISSIVVLRKRRQRLYGA